MKALLGPRAWQRALPLLALVAALSMVYVPTAFGSSNGMHSENPAWPGDFAEAGCTSCHGDHNFAPAPNKVTFMMTDAEGNDVTSGAYEHDATYTITITLADEQFPEAGNHAGFYLSANDGEFAVIDGTNVQVTGGGLEASHTDASATQWTVQWTAPAEGAILFQLLVNDVDGNGAPALADSADEPGDHVYRSYFALTDEEGAQLGAAEEEHEAHYGVSLPQYWLGLIALASMIFVILFSFVYMKYVSPHNADQDDR